MQLSVIIVNYNVRHFLEQCLFSVQKALASINAEVIVIDNNSGDNSIEYLKPKFPSVQFVSNMENAGFTKACNQGFRLSKGKYILFLNPDTLVPEDCFQHCIGFLESHPDSGALGIKMLDGSGRFLKESKRGLPSPMTSLYKLFGLSGLFPRSKIFSKYYLGNIREDQSHEVDVLAGAFLMVKREVFEKINGFDEIFFMYGEDVNLSYRIKKLGYKNYYFSDSSIIHFKGESTRKNSLNYIRLFYGSMSLFVRKHYSGGIAKIFQLLLQLAILFRALMTAMGNFIRRIGLPLIDAGLIFLSLWLIKNFWNHYVRTDVQYSDRLLWISFTAFTIVYLVIAYYAGLYDRWYRRGGLIRSTIIATVVLLAIYSLLPERFRFSRAIILFGALIALVFISASRWLWVRLGVLTGGKENDDDATTVIIGSQNEYLEVIKLMEDAGQKGKIIGRVSVDESDKTSIGHWKNLNQLVHAFPFKEMIFCEGRISFKEIIGCMAQLPKGIKIKFHASGSSSIVSSFSKNLPGEALSKENGFQLSDPYNKRIKRLTDVLTSSFFLLTFPVHFVFVKKPFPFFKNCFLVLFAKKTWVGYAAEEKNLPRIRNSILACNGNPVAAPQNLPQESLRTMDYWYAKDYAPANDWKLVWGAYRRLGGE